jgi:hypothetical protein
VSVRLPIIGPLADLARAIAGWGLPAGALVRGPTSLDDEPRIIALAVSIDDNPEAFSEREHEMRRRVVETM